MALHLLGKGLSRHVRVQPGVHCEASLWIYPEQGCECIPWLTAIAKRMDVRTQLDEMSKDSTVGGGRRRSLLGLKVPPRVAHSLPAWLLSSEGWTSSKAPWCCQKMGETLRGQSRGRFQVALQRGLLKPMSLLRMELPGLWAPRLCSPWNNNLLSSWAGFLPSSDGI